MLRPLVPFLVLLLLFFSPVLYGQISGVVKVSGTDQPAGGATVFINKTSISTISNAAGEFGLTGIAPGFVELIIYKNGYTIFKSPIRIVAGKAFKLTLKLTVAPEETTAKKTHRGSEDELKKLNATLLGAGPLALQTKLSNPKDVTFSVSADTLKVHAKEPLVFENQATGYRISYYADNVDVRQILSSMIIKFDTLAPRDQQQLGVWRKNRENNFFGSRRHLFSAFANGKVESQGFILENESGKRLVSDSLIKPVRVAGYTIVKLKGKTRVIHSVDGSGREDKVSWLMPKEDLAVNSEGMLLNEKSVEVSGAMKIAGLADMMPLDYYPTTTIDIQRSTAEAILHFQEKIYIQTDKPYYYPGEPLWFKAYVHYYDNQFRDSLSRIMYVDLVGPDQKIILTQQLKIDSGTAHSDFVVPDSLTAGNYTLRAFTNLMRNFSDRNIFQKTLPVLSLTDKADPGKMDEPNSFTDGFSITSRKTVYKLREKIDLFFGLKDSNGQPLFSNFSVSVTDALQVAPDPANVSITQSYPFDAAKDLSVPSAIKYPLEPGVTFSGQFLNDRGKKEKATITIVQGNFEDVITSQTDDQGVFTETGLHFYDSMTFSFSGKNEKDKPYGTVKLLRHESPSLKVLADHPLKIINTTQKQRVVSELEVPHEATVLQEVDVTARRLQGSAFIARRYGRPARMFSGDKMNGTDMLNSLISIMPQLKVLNGTDENGLAVRSLTLGTLKPGKALANEPLIYVDDVYRGGGAIGKGGMGMLAYNALMMLNPKNVDHIELFDRPNMMIEMEGGAGLIAIFMKPGSNASKTYKVVKVPGYNRGRFFKSPQYDGTTPNTGGQDYRSTIYWNPEVNTIPGKGETVISFYAADLPGKYRVIAEGISQEGKPIRGEYYFEVVEP